MKAVSLRTEYLKDPIAIDIIKPRLFWKCAAEGKNRVQTAYRIVAELDDGTLAWDTGKVIGSRMTHILYAGKPLQSRSRVFWCVQLWDENDAAGDWSEPASFEMGLLNESDWSAHWITAPIHPDKKKKYPADYFKRDFAVTQKVTKARLYITACGLYIASINGCRVGQDCLTPGFTEYYKHLQYQTYDVTGLINAGGNALTVVLGDGWFKGKIGAYNRINTFGTQAKLLAQLELIFEDGKNEKIITDESFLWSNDGPVRENDLKDGEVYDARCAFAVWKNAKLTEYHTRLVCSNNVPVREMERLATNLMITPDGRQVLDFSQNMAGYVEFNAPAQPGHTVILRFAETLDEYGNFTQASFQISRNPKDPIRQQITYICSDKPQTYKPSFCVMGFRYVLVENWPRDIDPKDFCAIAVYSAMEETGDFQCSHPLVNKLVQNTRWSMKSNFLDVPTDCPQRERNPWTGDAQVFFETGSMLMNIAPFMRKWMRDMMDAQKENGLVQSLAPFEGESWFIKMLDGSIGWADAIMLIPYRYYKVYGDVQIVKECYPAMKKYAEFTIKRAQKRGVTSLFKKNPYRKFTYATGQHWGEWSEPKEEKFEGVMALVLPRPEEATAYFAYTMACMSEFADVLGEANDAQRYTKYAKGAKKAYNYLFVKNDDIESDRPSKLVRPLALGLLDGAARTNVARRLAALTEKRNYTIGTGFLSTPFVLESLAENGYPEHAFKMLLQERMPGWLYPIKRGATTIWENWEGLDKNGLGSLNHYSKGAVCFWLLGSIAGIKIGGKGTTFTLRPLVTGQMNDVKAEYDSIYGKVKSGWVVSQDKMELTFMIPANTTALICLPDGTEYTVGSGEYTYQIKNPVTY